MSTSSQPPEKHGRRHHRHRKNRQPTELHDTMTCLFKVVVVAPVRFAPPRNTALALREILGVSSVVGAYEPRTHTIEYKTTAADDDMSCVVVAWSPDDPATLVVSGHTERVNHLVAALGAPTTVIMERGSRDEARAAFLTHFPERPQFDEDKVVAEAQKARKTLMSAEEGAERIRAMVREKQQQRMRK